VKIKKQCKTHLEAEKEMDHEQSKDNSNQHKPTNKPQTQLHTHHSFFEPHTLLLARYGLWVFPWSCSLPLDVFHLAGACLQYIYMFPKPGSLGKVLTR
jgi:hypothetical protein